MCTNLDFAVMVCLKRKTSKKKKKIYCLLTALGKLCDFFCPLPLSFLPPFHSFLRLPWSAFESIVQEAVVLYVGGHCTVIEQSLLDTTLGRSPPKAFEQIICTRVLVNYFGIQATSFSNDLPPYKVCRESRGNKITSNPPWPLALGVAAPLLIRVFWQFSF